MKTLSRIILNLTPITGVLFAFSAHAVTLNFDCITFNNAADCGIGESQIQVDVADPGSSFIDFTFTNIGDDQSTISEIYFDDNGFLENISAINSSTGVSFDEGARPPDLPGGMAVGFEASTGLLASADNPAPANGVNADPLDFVTITFALMTGISFEDALSALGTDLRIGIHVINFGSGGSESFVTPAPVPLPAGVWLMGSALLSLVTLGRRKKRCCLAYT